MNALRVDVIVYLKQIAEQELATADGEISMDYSAGLKNGEIGFAQAMLDMFDEDRK